MTGVVCGSCMASSSTPLHPTCERADCPGRPSGTLVGLLPVFASPGGVAMPETTLDAVAMAYGLLWLFQGDSLQDPNARLAHEARRRLAATLPKESRERGIVLAKARARQAGVIPIGDRPWQGREPNNRFKERGTGA